MFKRHAGLIAALAVHGASPAVAAENVLDELRFGASTSVQNRDAREQALPEVTFFVDPFEKRTANDWKARLVRPRIHFGTSIGIDHQPTQIFSGFSWTFDLSERAFVEAGFGGVWHDGPLGKTANGPGLGCRLLFHEYAGIGYKLDTHWNVLAQVSHSSHADLCDGPNGGMTRAGLQIGYKF
ncbi:acyloxyacyl hydrolase [Agrobacterium sp. T29]|uniref:acyloxyacyl hydrolase n=1 Tax=Agrobacterium sp. T29 TaxID=2580515 RepID=UPI00115E2E65|nr:acyloxyacyl hydrolase [Agrobacterium sp. T29]